jgi:hypothetical protein
METKPTKEDGNVELTETQLEFVGQFNDFTFKNPNMTFEEVVEQEFGPNLFSSTPQGRLFEKECREVFEREREG